MTTLVLLHGWATDHRIWSSQIQSFSGRARLQLPDFPRWEAAWLADYLSAIPAAATILVGWSLGGMLALEACARARYRPRALVLIATGASFCRRPDFGLGVAPAVVRGMRQRLRREADAVRQEFYRQLLGPGDQGWIEELAALLPASCPPAWLAAGLAYLERQDLRPLLPQVAAEAILLIQGARDRIFPPAQAYFLQEQLPGAVLQLLPGTGHLPFLTQAPTVNRLLETFL